MNQDPARQIFTPFLPIWLRERLGTVELQPGSVQSGSATILYADLSGFTRLTAAFASLPDGAERLHDTLNRCYSTLIETIGAYGGDIASIAGDALTAWWADRLDLDLGRRCGHALLAAMAALPTVATPAGPFQFALRIGVSAGLVHVAVVGLPSQGLHFVLSGPALAAAADAERESTAETAPLVERPIAVQPLADAPPHLPPEQDVRLSWEHFLPPSFAERLRLNELIAEYRRCVPVFATFDLPRTPEELQPLVAHVQAVVHRWGGWLNEIEIGDKGPVFVLLFGAPLARGDDPSRAIGCCLELRARGLIARAGVTLGWLFVGAVGSPQRRVYTAQGDDMNLAAHLMQLAAPGEILVSGRVRNDIMGRYATTTPTIAYTKGHTEGVPVARVSTLPPRAERGKGLRQLVDASLPRASSVVGRTAERQTMAAAAMAAATGRSLIMLEGESGIGKTHLLEELLMNWAGQGRAGYSAECSSSEAPVALAAWGPIILALCDIDEGESAYAQRARLAQQLRPLPAHLQPGEPLLARALGLSGARLDAPAPRPDDLANLVGLATALVTARAGAEPILMILEDIHWADDASLQLAAELLRAGPAHLCLALSHRPLDGPLPAPLAALHTHPACTHILVGRLSSDETLEMIRRQLAVAEVTSDLSQHVERHAEGQPLFIKEYLRVMRQHNLVRVEQDTASLANSRYSVQVSSSAQGIIQARVDRLDEATRLTLKAAAVLGPTFRMRLLGTIHPARPSAQTLREHLDTLEGLQILDLELEGPERVYRFKHGITHEVAYTSLLFGQRRLLHAAVARWYEEAYAAEISAGAETPVYDQLIRHLGHAEEYELRSHYCYIAALRAAHQYMAERALRYVEHGLVFVHAPERRFALLLLRVAVNERAGNQVSQAEDLDQLDELAALLGGALRRAYADYFRLRLLLVTGLNRQVAAAAPALLRRLGRLERGGAEGAGAEAALLSAACLETSGAGRAAAGAHATARRLLRQALGRCQGGPPSPAALLSPEGVAARCLDGLGTLDLQAGRPMVALRYHRQALDLAGATGDWVAESRARVCIGHIHLTRGDHDGALLEARAALATSNAVSDRVGQARALRLLAAISAGRSAYPEAEREAYLAVTYCAAARARALEVQIWHDLAGYAAAQGLPEIAREARAEADRIRREAAVG